ncbi:MAG: excinuclease ABC subunit C [Erythrobacter sp.]|nr:excinuclease ABC subunit C [Erythrobacter sp.]
MTRGGWVYILTNKPRGVLYIGVTADITRRIWQHRNGLGSAFVRKYGLDRLVRAESYPTIEEAIAREKQLKNWTRQWKIELVESDNPVWEPIASDPGSSPG